MILVDCMVTRSGILEHIDRKLAALIRNEILRLIIYEKADSVRLNDKEKVDDFRLQHDICQLDRELDKLYTSFMESGEYVDKRGDLIRKARSIKGAVAEHLRNIETTLCPNCRIYSDCEARNPKGERIKSDAVLLCPDYRAVDMWDGDPYWQFQKNLMGRYILVQIFDRYIQGLEDIAQD